MSVVIGKVSSCSRSFRYDLLIDFGSLYMLRWLIRIGLLLIAAAITVLGTLYWYVQVRPVPIKGGAESTVIKVEPGSNVRTIATALTHAGLEVNEDAVVQAFRYFDHDRSIHVGRYLIKNGMTLRALVEHIASGNVIMSKITLVEGTETAKFLDRVKNSDDFDHPDKNLDINTLMKAVGAPEGTHPEGQFATDTFVFAAGSPDTAILRRAYREQQQRIKDAWASRSPKAAVKSPYELLILASIIEKETGRNSDRTLVSGVFNNRLKRGMLLQTDPTVVYGIQNFDGKITRSHLKTDHPYNTYTRLGLPPTPICNPGLAAIEAAAHPADTDYLYFVAMGKSGDTKFSRTLKEHNAAVQKYLRSQGL